MLPVACACCVGWHRTRTFISPQKVPPGPASPFSTSLVPRGNQGSEVQHQRSFLPVLGLDVMGLTNGVCSGVWLLLRSVQFPRSMLLCVQVICCFLLRSGIPRYAHAMFVYLPSISFWFGMNVSAPGQGREGASPNDKAF